MLVNIKIFKLQAMDTVRPAKSLYQFSAMQGLMSLQYCSAGLRHGHRPIRAGPEARLSESLGFCRKLYNRSLAAGSYLLSLLALNPYP